MSETQQADDEPDCPECGVSLFVDGHRGDAKHICHKCDRTFGLTDSEGHHPHRDPDVLRSLYHGEQMTIGEVAAELDVHPDTVGRWMDRHDIDCRSQRWLPDAETVTDIRRRLLGSGSVRDVAADYDRSASVVRRVARDTSLAADIGALNSVGSTGYWVVRERDRGCDDD